MQDLILAALVKPCGHYQTKIDEHIRTDKNSSIYRHLHENEDYFNSFTFDCFTVQAEYHLKIKEGMYIGWEKPNLNKKFSYLVLTLSI